MSRTGTSALWNWYLNSLRHGHSASDDRPGRRLVRQQGRCPTRRTSAQQACHRTELLEQRTVLTVVNPLSVSLIDGTNGFRIPGQTDGGAIVPPRVTPLGDMNGDGLSDFAIAEMLASPNGIRSAGQVSVYFGSDQPVGESFDSGSLDGTNGFVLVGAGE